MIRIKNTSKIAQVVSLAPTEDVGVQVTARLRVGDRGIRKSHRKVGDSIRLQPGETSRELPDSVEQDPTIVQLDRRGIVELVKI